MRDTLRVAILAALFLSAGCSTYDRELMGDPEPEPARTATATPEAAQEEFPPGDDTMGVGMFNELRYYGQWHWLDPFGWVWRPTVVSGWQPFVNGHWIWSQYGWMWVDYDQWGWATSHYGYWTTDFGLGWVWIPDYTWSPVQCEWFLYDDYISWAPVPPPGVRYKEPWEASNPWVSVPVRRFKETDVGNYRTTPKFKETNPLITRTAPDVREIERRGTRFSTVEVQLDRRVVGEREFARVQYPSDQETIIQRQRVNVKTNSTSARFTPVPSTPTPAVPENNGPQPQTKAKSKDSTSGSNNPPKKESNYKEKKSNEKKGDDKSKDESKSGKKGKQ